jgi:hypothetical protein
VERVLSHRRSKATLWVLTREELAGRFDRTIMFEQGRLISDIRNSDAGEKVA